MQRGIRGRGKTATIRIEATKAAGRARTVSRRRRTTACGAGRLLPEVLAAALAKYGHLSAEELDAHKMSHGHCVSSRYEAVRCPRMKRIIRHVELPMGSTLLARSASFRSGWTRSRRRAWHRG